MNNDHKCITVNLKNLQKNTRYVKQIPFVSDDGIYVPVEEYAQEGYSSDYKCIMTKEIFVEAYNKWIKCK